MQIREEGKDTYWGAEFFIIFKWKSSSQRAFNCTWCILMCFHQLMLLESYVHAENPLYLTTLPRRKGWVADLVPLLRFWGAARQQKTQNDVRAAVRAFAVLGKEGLWSEWWNQPLALDSVIAEKKKVIPFSLTSYFCLLHQPCLIIANEYQGI